MRCQVFLLILGALVGLTSPTGHAEAPNEKTAIRVALVDVSAAEYVPSTFIDLLFSKLSQSDSVQLIEREQISVVLREQQVQLGADQLVSNEAIRAGKFVGAEALVLLKAEPQDNEAISVMVRVVDARNGLRCWNTSLLLMDGQSLEPETQELAQTLVEQVQKTRIPTSELCLISVPSFFNRDDARHSDWLGPLFVSALEQHFSRQPGVVVMERAEVVPLIRERTLAEDLPETLQEAEVTIAGEYRTQILEGGVDVIVDLTSQGENREPTKVKLRGKLSDVASLLHQVNKAAVQLVEVSASDSGLASGREAQRLTKLGRRYLELHQEVEALEPLLAAYALVPDSIEIQLLLLQAGRAATWSKMWSGSFDGNHFRGKRFPLLFLLVDVARKVLDHSADSGTRKENIDSFISRGGLIDSYDPLFKSPRLLASQQANDSLTADEDLAVLKQNVSALHKRYLEVTQTLAPESYEFGLFVGVKQGHWWATSSEEALQARFEYLSWADELKDPTSFGYWAITNCFVADDLDRVATWSRDENLETRYEKFFAKLDRSGKPTLQACAELGRAKRLLSKTRNPELAFPHFERFVATVVTDILPNTANIADGIATWVGTNGFVFKSGKLALTDEQAGDLYSQVIRASLGRAYPRNPNSWQYLVQETVQHLEKSQQPSAALQLLSDCRECLQENDAVEQFEDEVRTLARLSADLQSRHPTLRPANATTQNCDLSVTTILSDEQLRSALSVDEQKWQDLQMQRIVRTASGYAIVCCATLANDKYTQTDRWHRAVQIALIRLNDKTLAVESTTLFAKPLLIDIRRAGAQMPLASSCPVTVKGDDVFVAVQDNGLLWFKAEGEPVHFSEKHLAEESLQDQPLVFDSIRVLAAADDKVYGLGSALRFNEQALLELDCAKGVSRVLYSPRASDSTHPMQGWSCTALTAGAAGQLIMLAVRQPEQQRDPRVRQSYARLYFFSDGRFSFTDVQGLPFAIPFGTLERVAGKLVLACPNGLGNIDPRTGSIDWLLSYPYSRESDGARWQAETYLSRYVFSDSGKELLALKGHLHQPAEWWHFTADHKSPHVCSGENWPRVREISDLLFDEKRGWLVLSKDRLAQSEILTASPESSSKKDSTQ